MSRLVRGVGLLAARNASLTEEDLAGTMGIVASRFGATGYTLDYYSEIVRDGHGSGNPLLFAESVPNIGSAQLSLALGLKEATFAVGGTRIAGFEAFDFARQHLAAGLAKRVLVVAVEEFDPRLEAILRRLEIGVHNDQMRVCGEGAVAFVLEAAKEAERRGSRNLATLVGTNVTWPCRDDASARREALRSGLAWASARGKRIDRTSNLRRPKIDTHTVGPLAALAGELQGSQSPAVLLAHDESGGVGGIAVR